MEGVSKLGWQVGKSLAECNQHMLDQEIACDVTFNVHPPDGSPQLIKAHRYMLIARSPVFEMMLCGAFKEATSAVIDIKDIEPHIFKDILRFVYTGEVRITADNVVPLKRAADMYIMETLVQQCTTFLENSLGVENAAVILTHSLMFGEKDLTEKTLDVIRDQTKEFVESDSFLTLSHSALEMFLKNNEMTIDGEEQVCQATVKWAKRRCGRENPDLQQIRDTLGDCLKQIRFGDMQPEQFNRCVKTSLLTDKEFRLFHLSFHVGEDCLESRNELKETGFNLISRKQTSTQHVVNRFLKTVTGPSKWTTGKPDAISFMTNTSIKLNGICLYGATLKDSLIEYSMHVHIGSVYSGQTGQFISTGTTDLIPVMLDKPISLKSNTVHTVEITLHGEMTFYGKSGQEQVECGGVNFTFSESTYSVERTEVSRGQIPSIVFTTV